jgi:hypothetical protein
MKSLIAILAAFCIAGPALAQAPATGAQPKPPAHQPGTTSTTARPAAEAPKAAPTANDEKVDPAKEAAIRHLMDITQTSKLGDNIANYITGQVHDGMGRALTPDGLTKFMAAFTAKFSATASPADVTSAMVPIYAHAFSIEDIQALVQFYESALGQRVVKALPDVVAESQSTGLQMEQAAALNVLRGMSDDYPELKQILPPDNAAPQSNDKAPSSGTAPATSPAPKPTPATPQK